MGIIAAPEGLEALTTAHPDVDIFCAALDERLNEHFNNIFSQDHSAFFNSIVQNKSLLSLSIIDMTKEGQIFLNYFRRKLLCAEYSAL